MIFVSIRSLTKCSSTLRISTLISWMVVFKVLFLTVPQFACTENRQKKMKTAAAAAWKGTQRRLIRFEYTHMYTERERGWAAVTTGEFQNCASLPTKNSSGAAACFHTASLQVAYQHGNPWQQEALVDCRLWWYTVVHLSRITFIRTPEIKIKIRRLIFSSVCSFENKKTLGFRFFSLLGVSSKESLV